MNEYIFIIAPIVWACVSTILSLVLYKTSESFFEEERKTDGAIRRIRLVGSTVIAALIFLGLAKYTSMEAMRGIASGLVRIPSHQISQIQDSVTNLVDSKQKLAMCVELSALNECQLEIKSVYMEIDSVEKNTSKLHGYDN